MPKIKYIHTTDVHNIKAAEAFIPILFEEIGMPRSVVDVGCGTGTWLRVFKEKGVANILGFDGDNVDFQQLHIHKSEYKVVDLSQPVELEQKFDLALCLEVAEHLPETSSDTLVNTLCRLSDKIIFSAAMPNQGGQNHINEQYFNYWKEKFNQRGFLAKDIFRHKIWNDSRIDCWYRQNIFLIEKVGNLPISQESVNAYYHPEIFRIKHSKYSKILEAHGKINKGEIPISLSARIFIKSLFFSLNKWTRFNK